nr:Chain A, AcrIE4-F7 [Pseudomonas citronellolis]
GMSTQYTYQQIAEDFRLWSEYVDTAGEMSKDEFNSLSTEDKVRLQVEAFGEEKSPKFSTKVTTKPDFDGFQFYIEAGRDFDGDAYTEAYGVAVPTNIAARIQAQAAELNAGEWLLVEHEA